MEAIKKNTLENTTKIAKYDGLITEMKYGIINGEYHLENVDNYLEIKNVINLACKFYEVVSNLYHIHLENGKENNEVFLKTMLFIFEHVEKDSEKNIETLDFAQLKKAIQVVVHYQELERSKEFIHNKTETLHKMYVEDFEVVNSNGKDYHVHKDLKNQFDAIINKQMEIQGAYEEAKAFLFASPNEEDTKKR